MKRIIAALVLISVAFSIGPRPADAERIMSTPEYQQELARRMAQ